MFLKMFGPNWKEKFLTLPGNLITSMINIAVAVKRDKSQFDMYHTKLVKLAFFMKHRGSLLC